VERHFEEIYSQLLWEITGVYTNMDQWIELRRKIRNQRIPLRQLQRETGIHRQTLIWNDLCQTLFLYFFIPSFFFLTLNAWAASTMNQSDIRGLAFRPEPTVIFFVASFAFYEHEFSRL